MDDQMAAVNHAILQMRNKWMEHRNKAYAELIELAELQDDQLTGSQNDNIDCAFEIIVRYGSCADNARAIKLYSNYIALSNLLEG